MITEFLLIFFVLLSIYLIYKNLEFRWKFEEWKRKYEEKIREDAIKRSSSILAGKMVERLVPFVKEFEFNPRDVRWVGDPIDFIVFDGYNEGKLRQIVFVEVKTEKSKLNKLQSQIKNLIKKRKIKWKEVKIKS